jgi:class 3 adenylate cyclase
VEAECRQVIVLFTDMVSFTTFSERAGEGAAFTLMRRLSKLMDDAVREYGGVVQSFTGYGVMAVFGAPVAFVSPNIVSLRFVAINGVNQRRAAQIGCHLTVNFENAPVSPQLGI